MDGVWAEIARQAPWGAVILMLVWIFTGYQKTRDELLAAALGDIANVNRGMLVALGEVKILLTKANGHGS